MRRRRLLSRSDSSRSCTHGYTLQTFQNFFFPNIPGCWGKRRATCVPCLDAAFAVTEAPSRSVCVQRVCSPLTFRHDVGCLRHTSSNNDPKLIFRSTLTFALAFISLPADLWTGILQKQAHVCCHGCNLEVRHLWPVRLFLKRKQWCHSGNEAKLHQPQLLWY